MNIWLLNTCMLLFVWCLLVCCLRCLIAIGVMLFGRLFACCLCGWVFDALLLGVVLLRFDFVFDTGYLVVCRRLRVVKLVYVALGFGLVYGLLCWWFMLFGLVICCDLLFVMAVTCVLVWLTVWFVFYCTCARSFVVVVIAWVLICH